MTETEPWGFPGFFFSFTPYFSFGLRSTTRRINLAGSERERARKSASHIMSPPVLSELSKSTPASISGGMNWV